MPIKTSARSLSAVLTGSSLLLALSLLPGVAHADEPEVPSANPQVPLVGDVVNSDKTPTDPLVADQNNAVNPDEPPAKPPVDKPVVVIGDENNNVFVAPDPNTPGGVDVGTKVTLDPGVTVILTKQIGGDDYSYGVNFHHHHVDVGAGGREGTGPGIGLHVDLGNHWTFDGGLGGGANKGNTVVSVGFNYSFSF